MKKTNLKEILKAQESEFDKKFGRGHWEDAQKAWHNKAIIEALDAIFEEVIGEEESIKPGNDAGDITRAGHTIGRNALKREQKARYTTLKKELEK